MPVTRTCRTVSLRPCPPESLLQNLIFLFLCPELGQEGASQEYADTYSLRTSIVAMDAADKTCRARKVMFNTRNWFEQFERKFELSTTRVRSCQTISADTYETKGNATYTAGPFVNSAERSVLELRRVPMRLCSPMSASHVTRTEKSMDFRSCIRTCKADTEFSFLVDVFIVAFG